MIAICNSDFKAYGCIKCGCDFVYNTGDLNSKDTIIVKCAKCGTKFQIFADGITISPISTSNPDILDEEDYYVKLTEHPRKGKSKKISNTKKIRAGKIGEFCILDNYYENTSTREKYISYFVKDIESGKRILDIFDKFLKIRNIEGKDCNCFVCGKKAVYLNKKTNPLDVRVSIFACNEHRHNLLKLYNGNVITLDKIIQAYNYINT